MRLANLWRQKICDIAYDKELFFRVIASRLESINNAISESHSLLENAFRVCAHALSRSRWLYDFAMFESFFSGDISKTSTFTTNLFCAVTTIVLLTKASQQSAGRQCFMSQFLANSDGALKEVVRLANRRFWTWKKCHETWMKFEKSWIVNQELARC